MPSSHLETAFSSALAQSHPGLFMAAEREFRFHPIRRWRFDFAWPTVKVAVEIEGIFGKSSRHRTASGYHSDCEKYNAATEGGWTVLRYTSKHISGDLEESVEQLARVIQSRHPAPAPILEPAENN